MWYLICCKKSPIWLMTSLKSCIYFNETILYKALSVTHSYSEYIHGVVFYCDMLITLSLTAYLIISWFHFLGKLLHIHTLHETIILRFALSGNKKNQETSNVEHSTLRKRAINNLPYLYITLLYYWKIILLKKFYSDIKKRGPGQFF